MVEVGVDSEVSMICTEAHESFWVQISAIWEVASKRQWGFSERSLSEWRSPSRVTTEDGAALQSADKERNNCHCYNQEDGGHSHKV